AQMLEFRRADFRLFAGLPRIAAAAVAAAAGTLVVQAYMTGIADWAKLLLSAVVFAVLYLALALQLGEVLPEQLASLFAEVKRAAARGRRAGGAVDSGGEAVVRA